MSSETALGAIDYFSEHSDLEPTVSYGFYGGEPLLAWPVVQKAIARIINNEQGRGRRHFITLTTNATLLTDAVMAQLAAANVFLTVSIDGPPEVHDAHRRTRGDRGTFARIAERLSRLRRAYPDYYANNLSFSVVLSEPGAIRDIDAFFCGEIAASHGPDRFQVSYIAARNARSAPAGAPPRPDPVARRCHESAYAQATASSRGSEWKVTNAYYTGKMRTKLVRRRLSFGGQAFRPGNQCAIGEHRLYVATDGSFYPCSALEQTEYCIGHLLTGFDHERAGRLLADYEKVMFERCSRCWAARLCRICMANMMDDAARSDTALDALCAAQRKSVLELLTLHCRVLLKDGGPFTPQPFGERWTFPDVIDLAALEGALAHFGVRLPDDV